ncbi:malate dehydrogenase [Blattella germanica]|nr:malate dehydrogenase [Blattella germanica]
MFLRTINYKFMRSFLANTGNSFCRNSSTLSELNFKNFKVTVCGASGGIGQPLSLMLKQSQIIQELALYDVKNTRGVAMDIGHVDTKCKVEAFTGHQELGDALADATIVLIAAGLPRKPGMSRNDLFTFNANIIQEISEACLKYSPSALIGVVTNPVNSTVPIACEVFKKGGLPNGHRIFGVTSLDVVRANTFVAEIAGAQPESVIVPVVGGHSATTIVPVLSQSRPTISLTEQQVKQLTIAIREAGSDVVKAKDGDGSATLSMAFAAARFTIALAKAALGEKNIIECAYVQSSVIKVS